MGEGRRVAFSTTDAEHLHRTLETLAETMERLQSQLTELARDAAAAPPGSLARVARTEIHNRALRSHYFDPRLFGDPAWDMLLDLFLQRSAGRCVCVSNLCMASFAPATTALRWIRALEEAGMVERSRDPANGRRVFVRLTPAGYDRIVAYLTALAGPHDAPATGEACDAILL